jgi:hypothetical protein
MLRLTTQTFALIATPLIPVWAAAPSIGFVVSPGNFQVDGSRVTGNATLFDGAAVETTEASSRLQVAPGARVDLAPQSRVKVFAKYAALERGSGELQAAGKYQLEARTLRIEPRDSKAVAQVRLRGADTVLVAAIHGRVRVFNNAGLVVADVVPGVAMSFVPQAGAIDASSLTGCLSKKGAAFVLTDEKSGVIVELRGPNLAENAGKIVAVSGTTFRSAEPVEGASSVVRVDTLKVTGDACAVTATGPAAPSHAGGGGMSNGAKVAIAVGIAGGAAGGIIAASSGGSKSR